MLKWKDLYELDEHGGLSEYLCQEPERFYERMVFIWHADFTLDDEACLYILPEKYAAQVMCAVPAGVILVAANSAVSIPTGATNCLFCPEELAEVFYHKLSESFQRQDRFREIIRDMLGLVKEGKDLQQLTESLAKMLGRPVAVVDNALQFLAISSREEVDQMVSEDDRNPFGVTQKRLQSLQRSGTLEQSLKANETVRYVVGKFTVYIAPLHVNGVNIAGLGFPGILNSEMDKLPIEYIYEMPTLASIFSLELTKRDVFQLNKSAYFPYIFSAILDEKATDIDVVREKLKIFKYDLKHDMYLLSVEVEDVPGHHTNLNTMADALRRIFTNSIYLVLKREILLLVSRSEHTPISEFELDVWSSYLRGHSLRAGMTGPFHSFKNIRNGRLKEARLALSTGRKLEPEGTLYQFSEFQTDALLTDFAEMGDLSLYCYEPLTRLIDYDQKRGTQFVVTLREYIKNSKCPQSVCDTLFIHKNTLYKRLDRIREIMGCDFDDAETLMKIQLTFHILKAQGQL